MHGAPVSSLFKSFNMKTGQATPVPRAAVREEFGVYMFVNGDFPPERLRMMAISLLKRKDLPRRLSGLPAEDQVRFLDRIDHVRRRSSTSASSLSIAPTKVLPTIDSENAKLVASLGTVCSAIRQFPSSAVVSAGLEKRGVSPLTPIGRTQIWRGVYGHRQVSIKVFPRYRSQPLEGVKEVGTMRLISRPST